MTRVYNVNISGEFDREEDWHTVVAESPERAVEQAREDSGPEFPVPNHALVVGPLGPEARRTWVRWQP